MALGCRKCGGNGGKLDSESFLAHLAALVGETARHVAAHATNDRAAIETPSPLPARASEPVNGTPGARYLVARRVWPAGERFPASVRWLPAASARRVGVRPQLPNGAARSGSLARAATWEHPLVEWARTATSYCSLVLDCDSRESQELAWAVAAGYGDLPRPNVAAMRASSGHLHLGWNLRTPVHRGAASRPRPLAALGRIAVLAVPADPAVGE